MGRKEGWRMGRKVRREGGEGGGGGKAGRKVGGWGRELG